MLTQDAGRRPSRLALHDGVLVRRFLLPLGASHGAVAPGLWDALRRSGRAFDLVHVHTPHPSFAAVVMRIGPRRKVFTPHAPAKALTRWPYMRVTRAVVEHATLTLCTSVAESASLAERIPTAAARIGALAGGVDAVEIAAAEPIAHAGRVVLVRGPLDQRRRIDRAIGAMASLADDYRLVIAGAGPAERRLAAHAEDLRVESRVDFAGPVGDAALYRWLRTARVAVSPSPSTAPPGSTWRRRSAPVFPLSRRTYRPTARPPLAPAGRGGSSCRRRVRHSRWPTRSALAHPPREPCLAAPPPRPRGKPWPTRCSTSTTGHSTATTGRPTATPGRLACKRRRTRRPELV